MPETLTPSTAEDAGASPTTFSQVGVLLSRPSLWSDWLAADSDRAARAGLFREAFSCVVRIKDQTGWSDDQTLQNLGCDTKTEEALSGLTDADLKSCVSYMLWVESLLKLQDLAVDRRVVVRRAARFFVEAGRDLSRVEEIMKRGEMSPLGFLALGETARAWTVARQQLEEPSGDRARRLHERNPFVDAGTPHLSPERVEMLSLPDADELLGPNVARRMIDHLKRCQVCEAAHEQSSAVKSLSHEPTPI